MTGQCTISDTFLATLPSIMMLLFICLLPITMRSDSVLRAMLYLVSRRSDS